MPAIPVLVPLLNANEPEARLVTIHRHEGTAVTKGELLFTIETTKAAADVESPGDGYLRLVAAEGDNLTVGASLAYLTESVDEALPVLEVPAQPVKLAAQLEQTGGELRITRPARTLAETLGIDLASLPVDRLITEAVIRAIANPVSTPIVAPVHAGMIIYGAGGHAKAVMEMARALGAFRIIGVVDDNPALQGGSVLGYPILGTRASLPGLYEQGVRLAANGVGGIVNIAVRINLFGMLAGHGFAFPALCHPRATVEASAQVADGVQVFANAYVGSSSILHERCMINTAAVISHDCEIGAYTHIAPGALLAGHVHVGERVLVGMGVTTAIGINIGSGARIGNGATLLADVPERAIVPAGKVWTI